MNPRLDLDLNTSFFCVRFSQHIECRGSDGGAVHLHNVANLGNIHELVHQPLAVHLGEDTPLVVIPAEYRDVDNVDITL